MAAPARLGRALAKQAAGLGLAAALVVVFGGRLGGIDLGATRAALATVGPLQWLMAAGFTLLSFWAVGRYDGLIHRHLRTGTPDRVARRAGVTAIAISQMAGLGLVTGALVRWRMLPGTPLGRAAALTATVAASFLAGWAMVTAAAVLLLGGAAFAALKPWAGLVLAAGLAAVLATVALPPASALARRLALPSLATLAAVLGLAAVDTGAAALALWSVLPAAVDPGPALLPAVLVALGAGLVLSTPGGLGPFELALLALLPGLPDSDLLAGVLAWRAVYFALPAVLAAVALARGPRAPRGPAAAAPVPLPTGSAAAAPLAAVLARGPRAETALLHLGEHALLGSRCGHAALLVGQTRQALVGLFDPAGPAAAEADLLAGFTRAARATGRAPCLYKLSPRAAARLRRAGWRLLPVAEEAVIDPAGFDLAGPDRAALRRKLRKASAAGVTVRAGGPVPGDDLARIAADWARARGGERGFSMGRYDPGYVAGQLLVLAEVGGRPVGFATFHAGPREWVLDLMRPGADCPDGAMQALVVAAIDAARAAGVGRLTLAAAPAHGRLGRALPGPLRDRLQPRLAARDDACGLRRFKAGFAPRWEPRYLAARSHAALALAAADLALHIRRPPPLPGSRSS